MKSIGRFFGDLGVRPKLMVLHNLFFLVLSVAVYFSLIPRFEAYLSGDTVREIQWALLVALATVYVLAVLLLELVILPRWVYRPLRLILDADDATRRGDRLRELIDRNSLPGGEIGQIMRSRNAAVSELRKQEDYLADALVRLEKTADDLQRKNHLLETAKNRLADQDRLASLGLMCAGVAHELNTPLAVVSGSIEKLIETVSDEAAIERLRRMERAAVRLRQISESLLEFGRPPEHGMRPVAIRTVVNEAWDLVAIDSRSAGIRFLNEVRDDDTVTGNASRLVQVFVNLIRNSLNALPSSGTITVRSSRVVGEGRAWIAISVEDDGAGIPADVLPHVFEAFMTSRLDARGTGLGLTVAEGIVFQHGGAIEASNRASGGARLEVKLPAVHNEATA